LPDVLAVTVVHRPRRLSRSDAALQQFQRPAWDSTSPLLWSWWRDNCTASPAEKPP